MRPKLDEVVPVPDQLAWVGGPLRAPAETSRAFPVLEGDPDESLRLLVKKPVWPALRGFLRAYIENAILEPLKTEPSGAKNGWWNITIREGGVRINILRQWVFAIDFPPGPGDAGMRANGLFYVDAQSLEARPARDRLQSFVNVGEAVHRGKLLKGNTRRQVAINFTEAPIDQLTGLFKLDWMQTATRTLNLDLMRAGQLQAGLQRFHVPKLVDAIFAEDFSPGGEMQKLDRASDVSGETISLDGLTEPERNEVRRLVWLRKNQTKFAKSVKENWHGRCALTRVEAGKLLEACHIKQFAESTPTEQDDPSNGICLAAHVHAAFDADLIGISPEGEVQYSTEFLTEDRRRMNLPEQARIDVKDGQRTYLEHRHAKFREKCT